MTTFPLNYLDEFTHIVSLDAEMSQLTQTIREAQEKLEAAVKLRAWLSQEANYLAWVVCPDGTVQTKAEVFAKLQPPPVKPVAVIEVKPVIVPANHIALLTSGYVAEKQRDAIKYDMEALS